MTCPTAVQLLLSGAAVALATSATTYPAHYDEMLDEVHHRLQSNGHATKLDLNALTTWKRVRATKWAVQLNHLAEKTVADATENAFAAATDRDRIDALWPIPGFRSAGAMTSALLAAWRPDLYGVLDKHARWAKATAVSRTCRCDWRDLPIYEEHLRQLARELTATTGTAWMPRQVDMALYKLGGG